MITIDISHVQRLIQIESQVHYGELPPTGCEPYVCIRRNSPVVLSAPHGARTFRNNQSEIWHEEDEYTAGMALLLSELCQTSVVATIWRTEESDPNEHGESRSSYKRALRHLVETDNPRPVYLVDLHGASENSNRLAAAQKVDLGLGRNSDYMLPRDKNKLKDLLEQRLGIGAADRVGKSGWDADQAVRIAAFSHRELGLGSVQIEMKPSVRVALRRIDASLYNNAGPYSAEPESIINMMQALVDFIEYLKHPENS